MQLDIQFQDSFYLQGMLSNNNLEYKFQINSLYSEYAHIVYIL